MLSSLDALAGKISPGSGKNSPKQQLDNNANKIGHSNHNVHPYQKPNQVQEQNCVLKETAMIMNNLNGNNNNNNNNNITSNNNISNSINNNNNTMCSSPEPSLTGEQPDPDYIKMFVGQVPKSMDENQLRDMFEEYGRVHSINVLRDKVTGISKGCCFVTFFTRKAALLAQDALHNMKTLDGMHHAIQMKPADSENRNERKLFIGMLNKKLSENEVRKLFEGHGTIEECTVLRDQNGQSKGCAFVTFSSKQAAIGAIKGLYSIQLLHQSQTMEGCSAPLVVKFADTQKEKEHKKMQQMHANLWNLTAANINIPIAQSAATVAAPMMHNPPQQPSPILATDAISPASIQLLQQLQAVGLQQQLLQGYFSFPGIASQPDSQAGLLPSMTVQNLAALAAMTQPSMQAATQTPSAQLSNALLWSDPTGLNNPFLQTAQLPQFGGNVPGLTSPLTNNSMSSAAAAVAASKHIEGPEGCNLFIYHLPQEFTDTDLASTFIPFGNVISAKVFIDKQTNLSKCFGFVSFDNPDSAQAAIKAMHGFPIGTKRLKVQLKKPKDLSKPY